MRLVTECVFLRPQYLRGRAEREVVDLVVARIGTNADHLA